jgi:hypothetical protein
MDQAGPPVRALLTPLVAGPNGASGSRLDVEIACREKYRVLETFAGLGATTAEAANSAFDNFSVRVRSMSFLLRSTVTRIPSRPPLKSGPNRVDYDAVIGNYTVRTFQGDGTPIPEQSVLHS